MVGLAGWYANCCMWGLMKQYRLSWLEVEARNWKRRISTTPIWMCQFTRRIGGCWEWCGEMSCLWMLPCPLDYDQPLRT